MFPLSFHDRFLFFYILYSDWCWVYHFDLILCLLLDRMFFLLCIIIPVYLLFLFANLKGLLYLSLSLIINSYSLDLNDYITMSSILKKGDSLSLLGRKITIFFLPHFTPKKKKWDFTSLFLFSSPSFFSFPRKILKSFCCLFGNHFS